MIQMPPCERLWTGYHETPQRPPHPGIVPALGAGPLRRRAGDRPRFPYAERYGVFERIEAREGQPAGLSPRVGWLGAEAAVKKPSEIKPFLAERIAYRARDYAEAYNRYPLLIEQMLAQVQYEILEDRAAIGFWALIPFRTMWLLSWAIHGPGILWGRWRQKRRSSA